MLQIQLYYGSAQGFGYVDQQSLRYAMLLLLAFFRFQRKAFRQVLGVLSKQNHLLHLHRNRRTYAITLKDLQDGVQDMCLCVQ